MDFSNKPQQQPNNAANGVPSNCSCPGCPLKWTIDFGERTCDFHYRLPYHMHQAMSELIEDCKALIEFATTIDRTGACDITKVELATVYNKLLVKASKDLGIEFTPIDVVTPPAELRKQGKPFMLAVEQLEADMRAHLVSMCPEQPAQTTTVNSPVEEVVSRLLTSYKMNRIKRGPSRVI